MSIKISETSSISSYTIEVDDGSGNMMGSIKAYSDSRNCGILWTHSLYCPYRKSKKFTPEMLAQALITFVTTKTQYGWKMIYYNLNHKQMDIMPLLLDTGFEPVHQWQNFVHPEVDIITILAVTTTELKKLIKKGKGHVEI